MKAASKIIDFLNKLKGWRHYILSFGVAFGIVGILYISFILRRFDYFQLTIEHLDEVLYAIAAIIAAAKGASYLESKAVPKGNPSSIGASQSSDGEPCL